MPRPFEVDVSYLKSHLDEMVKATFLDLHSDFLRVPKGDNFVTYGSFERAYETLKRHTAAFTDFRDTTIWSAMREDSLVFVVLRTILGMTPPEWADLAQAEYEVDIPQGYVRGLDKSCRQDVTFIGQLSRPQGALALDRLEALVAVAVRYITSGAPPTEDSAVHRLDKADTVEGLASLRRLASLHVPYATLLYERYLGRPFATLRDANSELVGDVMESAVENLLAGAGITFRKTKRAEKIPEFDQAPDFCVPTEINPAVVMEAKITNDDGTARDKATRIVHLAEIRNQRLQEGLPGFELIACIDGRGFGVRKADMRRMLVATEGKVFTLATLNQMLAYTRLRDYLPNPQSGGE